MEQPDRQLLLIINPISGTHSKADLDHYVTDRLTDAGYRVETSWTSGPGDASAMARRAADKGYYGVVVAGGDGTVNEAACGLRDTDTALGIIPCGSGNGLARHIGLGADFEAGIRVISQNRIVNADYGSVNDRTFLCTCGVGFDAAVTERFARQPRRGKLSYIKSTLQEFIEYHPQEYRISLSDGTEITDRAFLVAVCNVSQYGNNAYIAPHASIRDGLLDVTIIHSGSPLTTALVGVDLLTGFIDKNMLIDTFRTNALTIRRSEDGPIQIDGEPADLEGPLNVVCHSGGLRLFAPEREKEFKPIITPVQSLISDINSDLKNIIKNIKPEL